MYRFLVTAFIWLTAIGCNYVMKKIQPENYRLYRAYSILIVVLITALAVVG